MIHVRVPHVCSDDPVSSFALEPLLYILLREFPQRFARGHAEQQIVFVVTRDWGTVLRFLWQRPETKQIPFFPYCILKKKMERNEHMEAIMCSHLQRVSLLCIAIIIYVLW